MMKLSDYIGKDFIVRQKSFLKRDYEFLSDSELLGKMVFPKLLGEKAECTIGTEKFIFKRAHIFSDVIEIIKEGFSLPIAKLESNFFGTKGNLQLSRGRSVIIKPNFLRTRTDIFTKEDEMIMKLLCRYTPKFKATVLIEKRSEIIDEFPWIVLLSIYYVLTLRQNQGITY